MAALAAIGNTVWAIKGKSIVLAHPCNVHITVLSQWDEETDENECRGLSDITAATYLTYQIPRAI